MRNFRGYILPLVAAGAVAPLAFVAYGADLLPSPRIPTKVVPSSGFTDIPVQKTPTLKKHDSAPVNKEAVVDSELDAWFNRYQQNKNAMELKGDELTKFNKKLDEVSRRLVLLRHLDTDSKVKVKIINDTLKDLNGAAEKTPMRQHVLFPYLVDEIVDNHKISPEDSTRAWRYLRDEGGNSCPTRRMMLRDLDIGATGRSVEDSRILLTRIQRYKSKRFRELALESFVGNLPEDHRAPLKPDILKMAAGYPKILQEYEWISGVKAIKDDDDAAVAKLQEPQKSLAHARRAAMRRLCANSQKHFTAALKRDKLQKSFDDVEATAIKIEACYRSQSHQARLKFWQEIEQPLQESYGFPGLEMALRRRGLILWGTDSFEEARSIFQRILVEGEKANNPEIESRALFTFGRIEENGGKYEAAIAHYAKYNEKFPTHEEIENVRISLVTLTSLVGKPQDALNLIEKFVEEETKLPIDKRSVNVLPFALFWGGRVHMSLGHQDKAIAMWGRAAQEFYSTFYGSLGHFMVEKVTGKTLPLSAFGSQPFDEKKLEAKLDADGQLTYRRAKALLDLGLKNDARCEMKELEGEDTEYVKVLFRSMLQFVLGDWLDAVRTYAGLPRSYRNTLPYGMERILFPRTYEDHVASYTRKLELDPDIVFAIIRQESVFNPRARSPVGARGLMQLMPQTARMEAKSLRPDYIAPDHRKSIARQIKDERSLEEAEFNISLGVHHVHRLLERYKSPVFVLTAYNASPKATERWLRTIGTDDILAFIEQIPYRETKAYVKLVMRNYFYYKRWYGDTKERLTHIEPLVNNILVSQTNKPGQAPAASLPAEIAPAEMSPVSHDIPSDTKDNGT